MEGFLSDQPVLARVTWAGTNEVALLNGKALPHGLLAEIPTPNVPGGVTRYLVPWTSVVYLKQDIPAPPPADPPVPFEKVMGVVDKTDPVVSE